MSDLFNLPETLSPRLAWMKRHDIEVNNMDDGGLWIATKGPNAIQRNALGQTECEAITNLAKLLNIPLWNEEGFK